VTQEKDEIFRRIAGEIDVGLWAAKSADPRTGMGDRKFGGFRGLNSEDGQHRSTWSSVDDRFLIRKLDDAE